MLALTGDPQRGYRGQVTIPVDLTADPPAPRGGLWRRLMGG
ncbi:hypothetical protein ACEYYB_10450 [Paracoccus sp. p4-l81]